MTVAPKKTDLDLVPTYVSDDHRYYLDLGSGNAVRLELGDGPVDWSILSETGWKLTHPALNDRLNEYLEDLRLNGKAAERKTPPFYVSRPGPAEGTRQKPVELRLTFEEDPFQYYLDTVRGNIYRWNFHTGDWSALTTRGFRTDPIADNGTAPLLDAFLEDHPEPETIANYAGRGSFHHRPKYAAEPER